MGRVDVFYFIFFFGACILDLGSVGLVRVIVKGMFFGLGSRVEFVY